MCREERRPTLLAEVLHLMKVIDLRTLRLLQHPEMRRRGAWLTKTGRLLVRVK